MIEVAAGLFVGAAADYEQLRESGLRGWSVVHAAKDPWHREAVGYEGRGAPKDHAEYLWAHRDRRLALNLIDVDDPQYIRPEIIEEALGFIDDELAEGRKVLVHCNQGQSRGPTIALMWMHRYHDELLPPDFEKAIVAFTELYPPYAPRNGMRSFAEANW